MSTILLDIELLQPVLVTSAGGDPQTSVSFDYLPGSQLRGLVIAAWLAAGWDFDRSLFLDGQIRYLNGYPVVNGQRSLPTPRSVHHPKGEEPKDLTDLGEEPKDLTDLAVTEWPVDDQRQIVPWAKAAPFAWLENEVAVAPEVIHQVAVHVQRDRVFQRSTENYGALYRVRALAPGQVFRAAIVGADDATATALVELLDGRLGHLGGGASAGYGQVRLTAKTDDAWREAPSVPRDDGRHTVTCLSDVIVRNDVGQTSADPKDLAAAVATGLGLKADDVKLEQAFVTPAVAAGFNRTWGLPLPQERAFAQGSVLVVTTPAAVDPTALLEQGVGERRAEGFGRLAWDLPASGEGGKITVGQSDGRAEPPVVTLDEDSEAGQMARLIVDRIAERRLERALVAKANEIARPFTAEDRPRKSQIARLRAVIQEALAAGDAQRVVTYLEELETRSATRGEFDQPLREWLKSKADSPKAMAAPSRLPSLGGLTGVVTEEPFRINLRLLDLVLERLAKALAKRGEGDNG